MKLLFDQNLSHKLCARLSDLFPNSAQVAELGLAEADDRMIWQRAKASGFVLVTHDSDFADLAALLGPPPKVLWLRTGNQPTHMIERILRRDAAVIETFCDDDSSACLEIYPLRIL